jgi:hypothetical protein
MKTLVILISSLVLVLAAFAAESTTTGKAASSPAVVVYDAGSAFQYLKTLAGDWERQSGDHEHGSSSRSVTFRVSGAGSTVVETLYPGEKNEMVSIYHMDGKDLLLTHYCALQNAPVMKFAKSDRPGEIKFEFLGGTNFDPKVDAHVHEGVLRIKDENTFESDFTGFVGGKARPVGVALVKRKSS